MAERAFVDGGGCACKMRLVRLSVSAPRRADLERRISPSSQKIEETRAVVVSGCLQLFRSIEEQCCVSVFVANDVLEGCTTALENYVLQSPL
jgi:hypothetical protein